MARIVALDVGDVWTGIAISDPSGLVARPLKTVQAQDLDHELGELFSHEDIQKVLIGLPMPMRGIDSEQTKKVRAVAAHLQTLFPQVTWQLWDERLSSKRAEQIRKELGKKRPSGEEKQFEHARAAAVILDSYLQVIG